jgi:hypothetical protein
MVYGLVQLTIPAAPNMFVFMTQNASLGLLDGIYLAFIVPIAYELANKNPKRTNHAIGNSQFKDINENENRKKYYFYKVIFDF